MRSSLAVMESIGRSSEVMAALPDVYFSRCPLLAGIACGLGLIGGKSNRTIGHKINLDLGMHACVFQIDAYILPNLSW